MDGACLFLSCIGISKVPRQKSTNYYLVDFIFNMNFQHVTVLKNELVDGLAVRDGGIYIDGTLGGGGHSELILERSSPKGLLLGIDQDKTAIEAAKSRLKKFGKRFKAALGNFSDIKEIAEGNNFESVDGIALDLGVSSYQLSDPTRGFSFNIGGPLDMRMGEGTVTAKYVVNNYSVEDLTRIFREYGEERFAHAMAKAIDIKRKLAEIKTSEELAMIIVEAYSRFPKLKKIHPATKVFQAIRIEVNQELEVLKKVLESSLSLLKPGGRLAVITFHSLEDRIVKDFFKDRVIVSKRNKYGKDKQILGEITLINKKPIIPSDEEVRVNPRSRSAKLRIVEKNPI